MFLDVNRITVSLDRTQCG